jgi:RNA recognition motif-containing protein
MDEKFLTKVFAEYANVKNIKVIRDKITGMSQGYGFVEFDSCEIASYVLENCNGNLIPNSNKLFKLNWATFSEGKMNAILGNLSSAQEHTIYVCDLDLNVSELTLREVFQKLYPSVTTTKLIIDPITKQSKGYGFVKFSDYNESQKAIMEMNGKFILNKPIKTNQAVWKKYNPETPNKSNSTHNKPTYHKYNKTYNGNNNNNYDVYQQQQYTNFYHNNQDKYNNDYEEREIPKRSQQQPVYTQNINIYLQSLYQQHYMNNVYINQYCNISQDEETHDNINLFQNEKNSFNDEENTQNYKETCTETYSKMDK